MSALVHVVEYDTSVGVDKNGSTVRFRASNSSSGTGTGDPVAQVTSGYSYSYEKWLRLSVVSGSYLAVSNIRFFCAGDFGDRIRYRLAYRLVTGSPPTYATPVVPASGAFPPAGFQPADSYQSPETSLQIFPGVWNSVSGTGTGTDQPYLVLVLAVGAGATGGVLTPATPVWIWEET